MHSARRLQRLPRGQDSQIRLKSTAKCSVPTVCSWTIEPGILELVDEEVDVTVTGIRVLAACHRSAEADPVRSVAGTDADQLSSLLKNKCPSRHKQGLHHGCSFGGRPSARRPSSPRRFTRPHAAVGGRWRGRVRGRGARGALRRFRRVVGRPAGRC